MGDGQWAMGDGSIDDNRDNLRPNQYSLGAQGGITPTDYTDKQEFLQSNP